MSEPIFPAGEENVEARLRERARRRSTDEMLAELERPALSDAPEQSERSPGRIEFRDPPTLAEIAEQAEKAGGGESEEGSEDERSTAGRLIESASQGAWETRAAFIGGIARAVGEVAESSLQIADAIFPEVHLEERVKEKMPFGTDAFVPEVSSTGGRITRNLVQFGVGMIPALRATRGLKAIGRGGGTLRSVVAGGLAEPLVFDEEAARFSDLLAEVPALRPLVAPFVRNPDDTVAEAKLRQGMEGLALGGAAELGFQGIRALVIGGKRLGRQRILSEAVSEGDEATEAALRENLEPEAAPLRPDEDEVTELRDLAREEEQLADTLPAEKRSRLSELREKQAAGTLNRGQPLFRADADTRRIIDDFLRNPQTTEDLSGIVNSINLRKIAGPDDVRSLISRMAREIPEQEERIRLSAIRQTAEENGLSPEALQRTIRERAHVAGRRRVTRDLAGNTIEEDVPRIAPFTPEGITTARLLQRSMADDLASRGQRIASGAATVGEKADYARRLTLFRAVTEEVSSNARNASNLLNAHRITARSGPGMQRAFDDILSQYDPAGGIEHVARRFAQLPNQTARNALAQQVNKVGFTDMFIEHWYNAILSGFHTQIVNAGAGMALGTLRVPDRFVAAGLRSLKRSDRGVVLSEGTAMARGMIEGLADGMRFGWRTLRDPQSTQFSKLEVRTRQPAITGANLGGNLRDLGLPVKSGGPLEHFADLYGTVTRLPSRTLLAGDDFVKGVQYRAELRAQMARRMAHSSEDARAAAEEAAQILRNPPEDVEVAVGRAGLSSRAAREARRMDQAARDAGREVTLTTELGRMGKSFQRTVNTWPHPNFPVLKPLFPFVRLTANFGKRFAERTPLAPLSATVRAELRAGGARADIAQAKMLTGSGILATIAALTQEGHITGVGPSDPGIRKQWFDSGWRPLSARVGDTMIPFSRFAPVGTLLGLGATLAEISGQVGDQDYEEAFFKGVSAMNELVVDNTFLMSVSGVFDILSAAPMSPELSQRRARQFAEFQVQGLVPFGALNRQLDQVFDPRQRDPEAGSFFERSMAPWARNIERLRDGVESFSTRTDMPLSRTITGEPMAWRGGFNDENGNASYDSTADYLSRLFPTAITEVRDDPYTREMKRLADQSAAFEGVGFPPEKPGRTLSIGEGVSIEITPKERERLILDSGPKAKETLTAIFERRHKLSDRYHDASDFQKAVYISDLFSAHQARARARLREDPEIQKRAREKKRLVEQARGE